MVKSKVVFQSEEEVFEVEAILRHRGDKDLGTLEFRVKWKGFSASENTWEPEANLEGSMATVNAYWLLPTGTSRAATKAKRRSTRDSNLESDGEDMPLLPAATKVSPAKKVEKKKKKADSTPDSKKRRVLSPELLSDDIVVGMASGIDEGDGGDPIKRRIQSNHDGVKFADRSDWEGHYIHDFFLDDDTNLKKVRIYWGDEGNIKDGPTVTATYSDVSVEKALEKCPRLFCKYFLQSVVIAEPE